MKYHRLMRRLAAAALLAWIHITLLFAFVGPSAASSLPACCRKYGKHGCAMTSSTSGPALQAVCPMVPRGGAVPAQLKASVVAVSASVFAPVASHPAAQPLTEVLYRISYNRAGQKRGPPVTLA